MSAAARLKALLALIAAVLVMAVGYHNRGWAGFWMASGGVVFLALLYINRFLRVLRVASNAPKGLSSSAVMLNARLRRGMRLIDVVKLTRSLGQPQGALGGAVEVYLWTDPGGAWVECQFTHGALSQWQLHRPPEPPADASGQPPEATASP
ncbi:glycerate kinase [Comamonadaceae bacterium OH3737_COT-264]|nr:glycerate kinase [Comamonadaceae bacterium OH3737_COT-264]